ncbi:MAG TPA: metallophosphoesterase family protein [Candidatus Binatia bacterium]|jgi:hypothetical protein
MGNGNHKVIGVISDTHGLIRPEALRALRGVDSIIHAGDIGSPDVISALESVAEVTAIKGNNDRGAWARKFPDTAVVKVGKVEIFVLHDVKELARAPSARRFRVVISGHSHNPSIVEKDGVLFVNPGSAGPRRFKLPVAVARLRVSGTTVDAEIVTLSALTNT